MSETKLINWLISWSCIEDDRNSADGWVVLQRCDWYAIRQFTHLRRTQFMQCCCQFI